MLHPTLPVSTGVYLLPLRHPVLVARQLADIAQISPGRLTFGVGVGGEDRHEVSSCGVDPATRGLRMNECLAIVRELLTGKPVTRVENCGMVAAESGRAAPTARDDGPWILRPKMAATRAGPSR